MVAYSRSFEGTPAQPRGWRRFVGRYRIRAYIVLAVILLVAILLYPYTVITVPSGDVGVLWKRFPSFDFYCLCLVGRGTVLNPRELRDEGLHIIWPWDELFIYNLRLRSTIQTYSAISKDGVNVIVQANVRFQLQHDSLGVLHKFVGPNYVDSVVAPLIGSQTRQIISEYTAQQVYTSREVIQKKIAAAAQQFLEANFDRLIQPTAMEVRDPQRYLHYLRDSIHILNVLVLNIELPPEIVAAINRQTEQFYQIQEYKYRVERQVEEAKRMQVEANGIAALQRTLSKGILDSYLRWRGIEATLALAQSTNTKIVIIGSGNEGLPIILGNIHNPASPGSPSSSATSN